MLLGCMLHVTCMHACYMRVCAIHAICVSHVFRMFHLEDHCHEFVIHKNKKENKEIKMAVCGNQIRDHVFKSPTLLPLDHQGPVL